MRSLRNKSNVASSRNVTIQRKTLRRSSPLASRGAKKKFGNFSTMRMVWLLLNKKERRVKGHAEANKTLGQDRSALRSCSVDMFKKATILTALTCCILQTYAQLPT